MELLGHLLTHAIVITILLPQFYLEEDHRIETKVKDDRKRNCSNSNTCPTWFICNSQKNCQCESGEGNIVVCDDKTLTSAVLDCNCVTYENKTGSTFAGKCFYNCENHHSQRRYDQIYHTLPKKPQSLSMCSLFHRTGLLCGDCEEGHSPFVLSYNLSCVRCPDGNKNWWKFILVAFVPLTCFYFFVVLFNINVTSSRLHGVVWFSQALSLPASNRLLMSALSPKQPKMLKAAKILMIFYSLWNLDLLHSVIPYICLNVSTLQALTLEYILAIYPFLLILVSYFFISLHDRKCACLVAVWKPVHRVLTIFKKSWNIRTSTIDSFSTFFLLSVMKVLSVTADILVPTQIYKLGSNTTTFGLYYSPTVAYFGSDHLPYAILAIVMFTFFVAIPTLILLVYPLRLFQKCLSFIPFNWLFLHAFVDAFQGCYKDGTEPGTFDCRWFSAVMLLIRISLFLVYVITLSVMYLVYGIVIILIHLIAIINIQPFKKVVINHPLTEQIFAVLLIFFYVALLGRNTSGVHKDVYRKVMTPLAFVLAIVPLAYIFLLIGLWFVSRRRWINVCIRRLQH